MTPISSPRFSNGATCSTPGRAESAAVRSAHTSMTSRTCSKGRAEKEESWSEVKQTTSQRPLPASVMNGVVTNSAGSGPRASDGNRFSKTTTS